MEQTLPNELLSLIAYHSPDPKTFYTLVTTSREFGIPESQKKEVVNRFLIPFEKIKKKVVIYGFKLPNGKRHGKFSKRYNGKLKNEGHYLNGQKEGLWKSWYMNGQLGSEGDYSNGQKEGPWKVWYANGQLLCEGLYSNGKPEGEWKRWYTNGQLFYEGHYSNGQQEGLWKVWHDNGQLASECDYSNGKQEDL
jgi:antitoxin component YwqK of YwqJK toxin-antitoxin module